MKISAASVYACIAEAGTFKPGNVYPGRKGFLDFVVSAVVLGKTIERVCNEKMSLGESIKEAVVDRAKMVVTNTNLGIILLFMPLVAAAEKGVGELQKTVGEVVQETTVEDAVEVVEAMRVSGAYVGTPDNGPDVRGEQTICEIRTKGLTLRDLFFISSPWDTIASEWVNQFSITFSGAQRLIAGESVLGLYLDILSTYPDSLVLRRFGQKKAQAVCRKARALRGCSLGDVQKWDEQLYKEGVNPGTTADLVASSVFVALLENENIFNRFLDEAHII